MGEFPQRPGSKALQGRDDSCEKERAHLFRERSGTFSLHWGVSYFCPVSTLP